MNVLLVPGTIRVAPSLPVELAATVDGETLRLAIEWPVIERWLGDRASNVDAVREALLSRRNVIERSIMARVYAHGIPISGELTLTSKDFMTQR
jgi:hypothetical protein